LAPALTEAEIARLALFRSAPVWLNPNFAMKLFNSSQIKRMHELHKDRTRQRNMFGSGDKLIKER
jgi:hypothetical protein